MVYNPHITHHHAIAATRIHDAALSAKLILDGSSTNFWKELADGTNADILRNKYKEHNRLNLLADSRLANVEYKRLMIV